MSRNRPPVASRDRRSLRVAFFDWLWSTLDLICVFCQVLFKWCECAFKLLNASMVLKSEVEDNEDRTSQVSPDESLSPDELHRRVELLREQFPDIKPYVRGRGGVMKASTPKVYIVPDNENEDFSEGKYYAVAVGRYPGIYASWDIARSLVDEYSDNKHKRFRTREEAEQYLVNALDARDISLEHKQKLRTALQEMNVIQ